VHTPALTQAKMSASPDVPVGLNLQAEDAKWVRDRAREREKLQSTLKRNSLQAGLTL
jgi:hypothetical protein